MPWTRSLSSVPTAFGPIASFGDIAEVGLSEEFVLDDLTADGSGLGCDGARYFLTYMPEPNLTSTGAMGDLTVSVIYKELTGEIALDVPPEKSAPWIAMYSTKGVFVGAEGDRRIDSRYQYRFDLSGVSSLGRLAEPGIDELDLLSDLSVVGVLDAAAPATHDFDLIYVRKGDVNEDGRIDVTDIDTVAECGRTQFNDGICFNARLKRRQHSWRAG